MMDADARRSLLVVALAAAATFGFAGSGVAQDVPEGQSCGGLVCDLGLFGHKTAPKSAAASSPAAVVSPVPAPAPAATMSKRAAEVTMPVRKKTHVARVSAVRPAKAAAPTGFGTTPVTSALVRAPAAPAAPPTPVAAALAPPPTFAAAPSPPPVPITATPARDEPVVLSNPYVYNKPLKFMFQSVDPSQGVQ